MTAPADIDEDVAIRAPIIRAFLGDEIIADSFAGGGGASSGIELALGRSPDVAINHDDEAIAMHAANHPTTRHYTESVWEVDPRKATGGKPVALAWFSPDCKHHVFGPGEELTEDEARFYVGNDLLAQDTWGLRFDDARHFAPIPATGALGFWTVPPDIAARVEEQLR